jgi:hypothetical protein
MTVVVRDADTRRSVPPEEVEAGSDIVAVRGTIPVGALSIRSSSRKNDHHAAIVTDRVLQEVDK